MLKSVNKQALNIYKHFLKRVVCFAFSFGQWNVFYLHNLENSRYFWWLGRLFRWIRCTYLKNTTLLDLQYWKDVHISKRQLVLTLYYWMLSKCKPHHHQDVHFFSLLDQERTIIWTLIKLAMIFYVKILKSPLFSLST